MLSRYYMDEENVREREVAMYIDGGYITRGPAGQGEMTARRGWNAGWGTFIAPERLTWELDRNTGGPDRPNLCWGNERLTSEQFLAWLRDAP